MIRRQYIINPEFQMRFIAKFCLIVGLAAIIIAACVLWLTDNSTTVTIENTHVVVKNTVDLIYPIVFQSFLIASLFSALAVAFLSMFMTHKVAGPLYRLQIDVDRIKDGDYRAEFKVRSSDQLIPFAESLSEMSTAIRTRNVALKTEIKDLRSALELARVTDKIVFSHLEKIESQLDELKL